MGVIGEWQQRTIPALARPLLRPLLFREVRRKMRRFDRIVYMGPALKTDARRRAAALAFYDPERALADMHTYLWAVPTVPTPFVGDAPAPGRYGRAVINTQQCRYPVDLALPKPEGVYRIFFTGSSTAFSSGAPDEAGTISGRLERLLNDTLAPRTGMRYEVVNAANPGWASTHERIWIEVRLCDLDPDMVIQYSGNNEAHWGVLRYRTHWMRSYAAHLQWVANAAFCQAYGEGPPADVAPREAGRVPPERIPPVLNRNVDQVRHLLASRGTAYVFVLHPTLAETRKPLTFREQAILAKLQANQGAGDYFSACYAAMRAGLAEVFGAPAGALRGDGSLWLDHADVFDGRPAGEEIFLDAYHFGDRGNDLMARRLLADLAPLLARRLQKAEAPCA